MPLVTRNPKRQGELIRIDASSKPPAQHKAAVPASRRYWVSVHISEPAMMAAESLRPEFPDFDIALQQTVAMLVEAIRTGELRKFAGSREIRLVPIGDAYCSLNIRFQFAGEFLFLEQFLRPVQPSLFG